MENQVKNYQEIISKLLRKQSFLDKTLLHNLLSHDCEQIFNLTCEIDIDNFIHLYGKQSIEYRVKQSNFWLGGENYYDNIKYKTSYCFHEIVPISITNIDKILYERISIYASTIECEYFDLKNRGVFQEWFNETEFTKEFYGQNEEYIVKLINRDLSQGYKGFKSVDWFFVSKYGTINVLEICAKRIDWGIVPINPNVTTDFVLKHINDIDMTDVVWGTISNDINSKIDLDDIPFKYLKKVSKKYLTEIIIQHSATILNNKNKLDVLENIAEYVDWDLLISSINMTQEFILRFNKYWNNDNKIVKSIKQNHN